MNYDLRLPRVSQEVVPTPNFSDSELMTNKYPKYAIMRQSIWRWHSQEGSTISSRSRVFWGFWNINKYVVVKKSSDKRENSCGPVAKNPGILFQKLFWPDLPWEKNILDREKIFWDQNLFKECSERSEQVLKQNSILICYCRFLHPINRSKKSANWNK